MIKAYFDHQEPLVTVHQNPNCSHAKAGPDQKIRHLLLNPDSLSKELARFRNDKHRLAAEPGLNDIWLILDFQDAEFELALVRHLKRIVGLTYSRIKSCDLRVHC